MRLLKAAVRFEGDMQIVVLFGVDGERVEVEAAIPDWFQVAAGRDVRMRAVEGRARERYMAGVIDADQFERELALEVT